LALHDRCTPQTRYERWHGHTNVFPSGYLAAITAGTDDHVAVGAWDTGRLVGFGSAALVAPGVRELGLLVEDSWQRRGVGREILAALVDEARRLRTGRLRADVLASQTHLIEQLARLGPTTMRTSFGVMTAQVDIRAG
jgi:GNAT superfamily N-acetyltransferase